MIFLFHLNILFYFYYFLTLTLPEQAISTLHIDTATSVVHVYGIS